MTTWTPPTPAEAAAKIQEMVRRIAEGFDPEKIILFGSYARGDPGPDSDVDLLVVMKTESRKESTRGIRIALGVMGIPKDVIVITPDQFEEQKALVGSIVYPAHHEGRVLYERQP